MRHGVVFLPILNIITPSNTINDTDLREIKSDSRHECRLHSCINWNYSGGANMKK